MPPPASSLMVFQTSSRPSGSSPVVGSSRKMTAGFRPGSWRCRAGGACRRSTCRPAGWPRRSTRTVQAGRRRPGSGLDTCPQLGDQHEILPAGEYAVHGGELPGQADASRAPVPADVCSVEAADAGAAAVRASRSVERMLTVVVLPAPFDPSSAKISPRRTVEVDAFQDLGVLESFVQVFRLDGNRLSLLSVPPLRSFFMHVAVQRLMPVSRCMSWRSAAARRRTRPRPRR